MPEMDFFQGGLELSFFSQYELENSEEGAPSERASIIARNAARLLMMGWKKSWTNLVSLSLAYDVLLNRNHELLRELRFAFQQGFFNLFEQLRQRYLTEVQHEQVQLYLSNCLSLLPFSDLTPYESIKIPQYIDGLWELVEYQVTPIELTDRSGWGRYFIQDTDRVFAYGLQPLFQKKAESHLIFMGTTYPAGQGFLSQVHADSKGFETVGKSLYRTGRERIQMWLGQQENATHVCGVSLGGSLSLLLAIDKGNYKLSRIDALNPAGLHDSWTKSRYDLWDELEYKPRVVVQKQGNDPVSAFGIWKDDWEILHVIPPKDKQGPNAFCDHFLNYAGFAETKFVYVDAEKDNIKRKARNFWLYSLGRVVIYFGLLLPYSYVMRPLIYMALQNTVLSGHVFVFVIAATLSMAGLVPGVVLLGITVGLFASVRAFSTSYFVNKDLMASTEQAKLIEKAQIPKMHDPSLNRNPTMDMYNRDNSVTIELSYQQIHSYYRVMRCFVKGKDFLPDKELESKHIDGVTKKALLETCEKEEKADAHIPFKVTKAKAAHINHSLTAIHQIGIENKARLKQALEKSYVAYQLGKHIE